MMIKLLYFFVIFSTFYHLNGFEFYVRKATIILCSSAEIDPCDGSIQKPFSSLLEALQKATSSESDTIINVLDELTDISDEEVSLFKTVFNTEELEFIFNKGRKLAIRPSSLGFSQNYTFKIKLPLMTLVLFSGKIEFQQLEISFEKITENFRQGWNFLRINGETIETYLIFNNSLIKILINKNIYRNPNEKKNS